MLIYHPAFDIYHGAVRILALLDEFENESTEIDRVRLWDFYFVFPGEIRRIRWPRELISLKALFRETDNPYEKISSPHLVFDQMRSFQLSAISYLIAHSFLDKDLLPENRLLRTDKTIPASLQTVIKKIKAESSIFVNDTSQIFKRMPLYGSDGLKARTKLLEYRYDLN